VGPVRPERVQQLYEPNLLLAVFLTVIYALPFSLPLAYFNHVWPSPLRLRLPVYIAGACFTVLGLYMTLVQRVPPALLQQDPQQYALVLGHDKTFVLVAKASPASSSDKPGAGSIAQASQVEIRTDMGAEEFARWSSQIPELATRWGYAAPAPQPPRYTSESTHLFLAWKALGAAFLLLYLRFPLYWLWRTATACRRHRSLRPPATPQPLPTMRVDF